MTHSRKAATCIWAVLALAGACAAGLDPQKQFESLFGEESRLAAASPGTRDDAALALRVLDAAKTLKGLPKLQALLCEKAYDFALRDDQGYGTAIVAMEFLARLEPDREPQCQEKLIRAYRAAFLGARASDRPAAGKRFAEQLVLVADLKVQAADWPQAESLYRQALGVATSLHLPLRAAILDKMRQAAAAKQTHARKAYLAGKLEKDPADAAARADLIRLYVVELDDPGEAVKILRQDVDETLRTYVPMAAKPPRDLPPTACLELGRWYQSLADKAPKSGKIITLKRAKQYYQGYLDAADSADAARAKARLDLDEVAKELSDLIGQDRPPFSIPGVVLVMTFDEDTLVKKGDATFVRDISGRDNDGLLVGAKPVQGVAGQALYFDGKDAHIDLGNPRWLQIRGDQTISMWLCPQRLGARRNPYAKAYGGEGTITVEADGTVQYFYGRVGADKRPWQGLLMTTPLVAGEWTHLVLVRDFHNGMLVWYRNGAAVNRDRTRYTQAAPSPAKAYIGKGYVENFLGKIDEVAVFARALSPQEVQTLYDLGREGKSLR